MGLSDAVVRPLFVLVVVLVVVALLARFLTSEFGLAMRATGVNARMARAQGVSTDLHIYVGMAMSNALVGLAGALFAQTNGFADVTSGIGTIVIGLAAVIVGETVVRSRIIVWMLVGCVVGSILYRIAIQVALNADFIGLRASDLNLVTALLVAGALDPAARAQSLESPLQRGGRVPMITAKNLHVTFGRGTPLEKHALRGVDLAIPSGQFVTVIGSNGAGKSTVLGALAGDVIPERGNSRDRRYRRYPLAHSAPRRSGRPRLPGPHGGNLRHPLHRGKHGAGGGAGPPSRPWGGCRKPTARRFRRADR